MGSESEVGSMKQLEMRLLEKDYKINKIKKQS